MEDMSRYTCDIYLYETPNTSKNYQEQLLLQYREYQATKFDHLQCISIVDIPTCTGEADET